MGIVKPLIELAERDAAAQHRIFFLRVRRRIFVGQSQINGASRRDGIVDPGMLLGELHTIRGGESGLTMQLVPLSPADRRSAFEAALNFETSELEFPFGLLDADRRELVPSPRCWEEASEHPQLFDPREEHLRVFTRRIIPTLKLPRHAVVFDPACSTGTFLASVGEAFPELRLYGADVSPRMVDVARTILKQVELATPGNVDRMIIGSDVLVLRFLNAEVVRSEKAESLFRQFAELLPSKSYMLVMGYTPVAISIPYLASHCGMSIIRSIGGWGDTIFQYYVLRKR